MKIGELAAAAQTQVETVRYYEREGLLPPAPRTAGNYRVYGSQHLERLAFVRRCRSLDMPLDEVRELLRAKDAPRATCATVNALIDAHIARVATRMQEMQLLQAQLLDLRAHCVGEDEAMQCGILHELATVATVATPAQPGSARVQPLALRK
jgi:Cd(II)/Pb(II)-responsive transcriptional regulator